MRDDEGGERGAAEDDGDEGREDPAPDPAGGDRARIEPLLRYECHDVTINCTDVTRSMTWTATSK